MTIDQLTIRFREECMSHTSAEEFLSHRGEEISNYTDIFLSVPYTKSNKDYVYQTELNLARTAIEKGCKFVSDMDYTRVGIVATGLKPRHHSIYE